MMKRLVKQFENNIILVEQKSYSKGNEKLKSYGNPKQMKYVTARGDGSLGAIQEVDADYETTLRHTVMQSEIAKKSVVSGLNFSNPDGSQDDSHFIAKSNSKY